MSIIRLINISKEYNENYILKDINIDTKDNEFVVILGKTGCGKTTLLRIIAGLETPSTGTIYLNELEILNIPTNKRNISMIFQNYPVYPHLNVYKNIVFPLKLSGFRTADIMIKIKKVTEVLGISTLLDRNVTSLSGGELQKVAIAKLLIKNPEIYLFDEPLSNIDAKDKNSFKQMIKELHQDVKKPFFYVTHDQSEATSLADRIAIIYNSEITQFDTPKNIYDKPKNIFVGEFFGNRKLNIIKGEVLIENDGIEINTQFGRIQLENTYNDLYKYINKHIYVGIRSNEILFGEPSKYKLHSKVERINYLLDSYDIYIKGNTEFIINTKHNVEPASEISFHFNQEKIIFFNLERNIIE